MFMSERLRLPLRALAHYSIRLLRTMTNFGCSRHYDGARRGRVADKRVLKIIRAFLNAGVMKDGLVCPVDEGTPQGVLNDLDKELGQRGHRFCRYADDCNIYVRSRRAGERVMASVGRFLTNRLKLKVNEAKSAGHDRRSGSSWVLVSRTTGASGASSRTRSPSSKHGSGRSPAGHGVNPCHKSSKN